MSSNILVSNGTCYSAAGKKLDKSFIPCGNAAYGHQTCCGAGDNCLGDDACFGVHGSGYGSLLTYMAGCTDPDYKDKSCPNKEGIDQPWIALTLCDHTDGIWAACSQQGNPTTLQPGSYCSCTDTAKATIAFTDANQLPNIASLPATTGDTISFFPDHTPTGSPATAPAATTAASSTPVATSNQPTTAGSSSSDSASNTGGGTSQAQSSQATGSSSSSGGTTQPGASGTNPDSSSQTGTNTSGGASQTSNAGTTTTDTPSGLGPGAKAGIAVAAAVSGLIFIAVLVALFLSHRRKRQRQSKLSNEAGNGSPSEKPGAQRDSLRTSEADGKPVSEADGVAARPWSMRSELEGDQPPNSVVGGPGPYVSGHAVRRSGEGGDVLTPVAELPGSEVESRFGGGGGAQGARTKVAVGDSRAYL
ncbi:hypothetical protein B0T19DRAFT_476265 [Cercophora scortea]|uniref:Uncharacterized protein n=1 Tax=Cercophora scortea TaxID=314031 RepID=A0AAE0IDS0_9PEZI|nr:hypothetical protein B0T19DRAFT_476265 [Cercophora scortea]